MHAVVGNGGKSRSFQSFTVCMKHYMVENRCHSNGVRYVRLFTWCTMRGGGGNYKDIQYLWSITWRRIKVSVKRI